MTRPKLHHYLVFLYRIFLVYVLMTFTRIVFYLYNVDWFNDMSLSNFMTILAGGLKFDTAAIIYLNIVFILLNILPFRFVYNSLYQKVAKWIFIVTNSIGLLANISDTVYYQFTVKRTTSLVFSQFSNEENLFLLFLKFAVDWWYMSLLFIGIVFLLIFLYDRFSVKNPCEKNVVFYAVSIVTMCLTLFLCFGGVRGGFRHSTRPISLADAGEYVSQPNEMAIVQNTPFTLIRTIGKSGLEKIKYFDENLTNNYFSIHHKKDSSGVVRKNNVVVFILESWSREYVGFLNKDIPDYKGYTPFIDSLMEYSLVFKYAYANGRKSIDAIPSVVAGIPYVKVPYVLSHYSSNKTCSLAQYLGREGYYTAFFHGAPNGSMGFQSFTHLAGFDDYYGKNEYNNDEDFDGIWGIWDEEFFKFFADEMNSFKEPFFTSVFSLSSHHPFKVPERYEGKFPKGPLPVHECIGYTDNALRNFFSHAKTMPWYENTLFVFTADHASVAYLDEYKNTPGAFAIPIFFYKPDNSLQKYDTLAIMQQIDILPSVLSYLNYPLEFCAFGKNIFDTVNNQVAIDYTNENYQCFFKDYVLQFDGKKSVNLYDFKKDRFFKNNLLDTGVEEQIYMENYTKSFIQEYTNRMIDNKMCE
ncbi:MAG: LTA synthase family protein [Bacteroidales bacterium]|nr:LTA synthase family protein [Bacteroidales bacterium]